MASKRRKDPLWARIVLIFGAVLLVASGGTLVAAQTLIASATNSITTDSLLDAAGAGGDEGNDISGAVNMLLAGIDARDKESATTSVLADTIIILHIPETHDQAYLISIPRDWSVQIPPYAKTGFPGGIQKINSSFSVGYDGDGSEQEKRARGMESLANTLNKITGIKFNGAALIDFGGFEKIIHAMGGVDMCVDEQATSIHLGVNDEGHLYQGWYDEAADQVRGLPAGYEPYVHKLGCRKMSSTLALDYARIRKSLSDGDYGRQRHQQQLMKAIAKQATSSGVLTDLGKLNGLVQAAGEAFILDTQGTPVVDFIYTLKGVAANDLMLIKTNNGQFRSVTDANGSSAETLDSLSMDMLAAAKDGTLGTFLIENPTFIAKSS
ncbi:MULTISPECIES: LCP family protein [Catenuloplanes]|uniref:LCP family protein required for cell wall assembly n=1 Tax=Catenuloplanes niger TaxID=587534 RepID=A0AAE4A0P4_9ACTN|nr:LCP family protein [Catenuloplanes niger]MDR7327075.1 LCP family protein required for cell wall assembly [Catenuloplanes niger]